MLDRHYSNFYFDQYVSKEFLGQLDPNGDISNKRPCDNSNGILFLAMGLMMLQKLGCLPDIRKQVDASIKRLQVPGEPGLFNRMQGDGRMDSHDNMVGIIILSVIFDLPYAEQIHKRGKYKFKRNRYLGFDDYFNYNNVQPGKFDWTAQRQGGDIAIYQMAAKKLVNPLYLMWFTGGLWISAWKMNPSTMNLGWFRLELMLELSEKSFKGKLCKPFLSLAVKGFVLIQKYRNVSMKWSFEHYFKPGHPMHVFLKALSS